LHIKLTHAHFLREVEQLLTGAAACCQADQDRSLKSAQTPGMVSPDTFARQNLGVMMAPKRRIHIQNVPKSWSGLCSHCDADRLLSGQFRFLVHAKGLPRSPSAALLLDSQRFSRSFLAL
jgi:hypothetical protein